MTQKTKAPLLLHIGYHKTATSFLQKRVFTDERLFSQPLGPQSTQALEWFVLDHPLRFSPEKARADFEAACTPEATTVPVISNEALSGQPRGGRYYAERVVDRAYQAFPDARILIGVREQKRLLMSLYYQHVRTGGSFTPQEFLQPPHGRPGFRPRVWLPHFEYDLMLELYRTRWAPENILVLPQELLRKDPKAYLDRLLDFTGLPRTELEMGERVNARRSTVSMQFERFANQFIRIPQPRPTRYRDYPWTYRTKNRVLQVLERIGPVRRAGAAADARIQEYVQDTVGDYFVDSNKRLAEMTGLDLDSLGYFA